MSDSLKTRAPEAMFEPEGENLVFSLTAAQYADLKQRIQDHGYLASCPVVVSSGPFGEGRILDGFHRSEICKELGIEPVRVFQPVQDEDEFTVLSIELNASRRQMTGEQIIYLRSRHRSAYDAVARRKMAEGGRKFHPSEGEANLPDLSAEPRVQTRDIIAAGTGIKGRTAQKLMTVFEEADEATVQAVLAGTMSADRAYKKVRPPAEQDALDSAIKTQAQAEAEIAETVALMDAGTVAETYDTARERAIGTVVRLTVELDKAIRDSGVIDQDVLEYRARPHTYTGTARRVADWLDLTAAALELNK